MRSNRGGRRAAFCSPTVRYRTVNIRFLDVVWRVIRGEGGMHMSEYVVVFPLDEVSMDMAMLLDDIIANDVDVEFVTTRGTVDALVDDPGSLAVRVGRSAGGEGLYAACARSLSRLA